MERLTVCETVLGKYAVRPHNWAGIWDYDGKLADGMNSIAVFEEKEDAEWYAETKNAEEQGLLLKEEDVLKFYYCESEDKYLVGKRVDTLYYAEVGKTGLCFTMSRYLPWGEHVVAPQTVWKEHTYPSEPKEIPFFDWLQGYMAQQALKGGAV